MKQDPIREQVIDLRRAQILEAAAKVFAERGFHRASTKEIAKTAGISEGTIYNYFANKNELLTALMARLGSMSELQQIDPGAAHDPKQYYLEDARRRIGQLRAGAELLRAVLPEVLVDPELRAVFLANLNQQYVAHVEAYLRANIDAGEIRAIADTPLMARLMQSVPMGLLLLLLLGDPVLDAEWDKLPEAMAEMVYSGLTNKEETK